MNIPKVKFKKMTLQENIDIVKWAFSADSNDLDIYYFTISCFPSLKNIDENMNKEEVNKIIEKVVSDNFLNNDKLIESEVDRYNDIWLEYNDKYLTTLCDYFGCGFPDDLKVIYGNVGILPVFPRDLTNFSFGVSIGIPQNVLLRTIAHEVLHFIWFLKWKSMYPLIPQSHFEAPYLEWKYSEMVTDSILNNKPFSDEFNFNERSYNSFYSLYDKNTLVMDKLRNIYKSGDDIETKISRGYDYIKEYFN